MAEVGYSRENMGFLTLTPDSMLYHYTSAEGLVGILNGEAWVTERHFLNDPSEFSVATDVFLEVADKHIDDKDRLARFKRAFLGEAAHCERFGEIGGRSCILRLLRHVILPRGRQCIALVRIL